MLVKSGSAERNAAAVVCRVVWLLPLFHFSGFISELFFSCQPNLTSRGTNKGDVTVCAAATQQKWHLPTDWIMASEIFLKAIIMQSCILRISVPKCVFLEINHSGVISVVCSAFQHSSSQDLVCPSHVGLNAVSSLNKHFSLSNLAENGLRCKQKSQILRWFCLLLKTSSLRRRSANKLLVSRVSKYLCW